MERTPSRGRAAALTALGVLAAVVVVALASRGSISAGSAETREPAQALLDVLFTLYLLAIGAGAVLLAYLFAVRRWFALQSGTTKRRGPLETALSILVLVGIASLLARQLAGLERPLPPEVTEVPISPGEIRQGTTSPEATAYRPGFAWVPALVTAGLVLLAAGAFWWSGRSRRRARGELGRPDPLAVDVAAAVDESLDDLRAEPDARRAVIAAYARLERVLAAHRLPRLPAETPLEYLARMLDGLSVREPAARRLTGLFERAKFSQHAVGSEMKTEAIGALEQVRDDLLAARALEEQERQQLLAAQRGQAAAR